MPQLDSTVLLGRNALERALREYRLHYLRERNHQGVLSKNTNELKTVSPRRFGSETSEAWLANGS